MSCKFELCFFSTFILFLWDIFICKKFSKALTLLSKCGHVYYEYGVDGEGSEILTKGWICGFDAEYLNESTLFSEFAREC